MQCMNGSCPRAAAPTGQGDAGRRSHVRLRLVRAGGVQCGEGRAAGGRRMLTGKRMLIGKTVWHQSRPLVV